MRSAKSRRMARTGSRHSMPPAISTACHAPAGRARPEPVLGVEPQGQRPEPALEGVALAPAHDVHLRGVQRREPPQQDEQRGVRHRELRRRRERHERAVVVEEQHEPRPLPPPAPPRRGAPPAPTRRRAPRPLPGPLEPGHERPRPAVHVAGEDPLAQHGHPGAPLFLGHLERAVQRLRRCARRRRGSRGAPRRAPRRRRRTRTGRARRPRPRARRRTPSPRGSCRRGAGVTSTASAAR